MHNKPLTVGDFTITNVVSDPPWQQNCYIVQHVPSGAQLILDPGATAKQVLDRAKALGGTVEAILLTHGHPDHIEGADGIQAALKVACHAHAEEKVVLDQAPAFARMMGMQIKVPVCTYFKDEPVLTLGGASIRTLFCPGHTPGGVTFAFDGFAFTGDTLFNQGVGRTDFPGGNQDKLWASIGRLLAELPEETLLFSGHGPHWTVGQARKWWAYAS